MLVKNWMSKNVVTINEDDSMQDAMKLMKQHSIRMLPVLKNNDLVGVVTDRDLKRASASGATTLDVHELLYLLSKIKVRNIMSKNPVHPGMIITELGRHLGKEDIEQLQSRAKERASSGTSSWKTPPQGAATQCWAVTALELAGRGGLYLEDCQLSCTPPPPGSQGAEAWALDPEEAERLWSVSEETLGERFAWT